MKRSRKRDRKPDSGFCPGCWPGPRPNERAGRCERALLERGWRPFPEGHSLPHDLPHEKHHTRVATEGEPRSEVKRRHRNPCEQWWYPRWVDAIQKAFAASGVAALSDEQLAERVKHLPPLTAAEMVAYDNRVTRDKLLRLAAGDDHFRAAVMAALRLGGVLAVQALLHSRHEGQQVG